MVQVLTAVDPLGPSMKDMNVLKSTVTAWDESQALDMVLLGYSALWPMNLVTSAAIMSVTNRIGLLVAHRPGVMHPSVAARAFATLESLGTFDRVAVNIVSGSSDKDLHREGDYLPKAERYQRATEYVELIKDCWTSSQSFDHEGTYFKADGIRQPTRRATGHIPIFMGGESDEAVKFGAQHADVYMLVGEPLSGTAERIDRVKRAAKDIDRLPRFSLSLRLFLGDTEDEAWSRARAVQEAIANPDGSRPILRASASDQSIGRQRQLATASEAIHDDCFWTGLIPLLGGLANSAALVGTPDRVLESLRKYQSLGIDLFLITTGAYGFWDPSLEAFGARMKYEL